jgi:hypothetical protein
MQQPAPPRAERGSAPLSTRRTRATELSLACSTPGGTGRSRDELTLHLAPTTRRSRLSFDARPAGPARPSNPPAYRRAAQLLPSLGRSSSSPPHCLPPSCRLSFSSDSRPRFDPIAPSLDTLLSSWHQRPKTALASWRSRRRPCPLRPARRPSSRHPCSPASTSLCVGRGHNPAGRTIG